MEPITPTANPQKLRFLLYVAIFGFAVWALSELMELLFGDVEAGFYMTAVFHFLAGFGMWGLYLLQAKRNTTLSLVGVAIISLSYFAIVYLPVQVKNSGLSTVTAYVEETPVYAIPLSAYVIGHILFGIAVFRINWFPKWTGVMLIVSVVVLGGLYTYEIFADSVPSLLHDALNLAGITLAATVIYMCVFGLNEMARLSSARGNAPP